MAILLENIGDYYHFGRTGGDPSQSALHLKCVDNFTPRVLSVDDFSLFFYACISFIGFSAIAII